MKPYSIAGSLKRWATVFSLLAYVAEQERKKNRQRQAEGIEVARADGVTFGRPRQEIDDKFIQAYLGKMVV